MSDREVVNKDELSDEDIFKKMIQKYGEVQLVKAIEELSELSQAVAKYVVKKNTVEKLEISKEKALISHIAEEMADVCIMMGQLEVMLDIEKEIVYFYNKKMEHVKTLL